MWLECVGRDMKELGLRVDDARDREIYKCNIWVKRLSSASIENRS